MSVKFEDYYARLGVSRQASAETIQKAYRKLARMYHPDVSKEPDAEENFKRINEAYEVLKDPQTRARYDALGSNYKAGQNFRPPPGWGFGGAESFGGGNFEDIFGHSGAGFSDFFTMFMQNARTGGSSPSPQRPAKKGAKRRVKAVMTLEQLHRGDALDVRVRRPLGEHKTYAVRVPPGTCNGSVIRLAGQGERGSQGGRSRRSSHRDRDRTPSRLRT